MAEDDALFQKGMPIRREVLGPEYVDASMARADEFMMSFQRATTAWAWGWAWGDPTLDRKTRSLMNLAMLTALNRAPVGNAPSRYISRAIDAARRSAVTLYGGTASHPP
jgi:4-carboxymuconolactone decarboxylase